MTHDEIASLFSKEYNGKSNFVTPNTLEYGKSGPWLYEISSGRGMFTDTIYGVTVLYYDGKTTDRMLPIKLKLNKCFNDDRGALANARTWARGLRSFLPTSKPTEE